MLPIVVLAGGLATRLRPITETIPKSLIPVNDTPFVLHQLELFHKYGIEHIHFCLGYLAEQVIDVLKSSKFYQMLQITWSADGDVLLGTGGAVQKAFPYLPEHFFVTYGDSYLDVNYRAVEDFFTSNSRGNVGLMTIFRNEGKWDKSNVIFKNDELLLYDKNQSHSYMEYIDYGLGILNKKNFDGYTAGTTFDLAEIYHNMSVKRMLMGFEVKQRFYEVGSFTGIDDLSTYLKQKNDV